MVEMLTPEISRSPFTQTSVAFFTCFPAMADVSNAMATICWFPLIRIRPCCPAFRSHSPSTMTIELSLITGNRIGSSAMETGAKNEANERSARKGRIVKSVNEKGKASRTIKIQNRMEPSLPLTTRQRSGSCWALGSFFIANNRLLCSESRQDFRLYLLND